MALVIPTPESIYRGNYASLPANTLKPPIEANRTVPVEINWLNAGQSPRYTIHFNARQQQTLPISQISSLHIDNSNCGSSMHVAFPDTQFEVICGPNTVGFYPVVTNSLEFWAWIDLTPLSQDKTIIQVLNFLPPPIFFTTQPGGTGVGTVRNVGTAAPITGGPITDSGTIGLSTPLAISFGGTGAVTAPVALDNLASVSGGAAGALTRSSGGIWLLTAAGAGTISAVNAGTGLTGGGTTGAVTVSLAVPVSVANGGTGGTTPAAALAALGAAPLANPVFTGDPQAPTPALSDNDVTVATTAYVKGNLVSYLPLSGGLLSGGLASGPPTTPVPTAGAITLNESAGMPATAFPESPLSLYTIGGDGLRNGWAMDAHGNVTASTNTISARRGRGTAAAPTAVQNGDLLFQLATYGRGATNYGDGPAIQYQPFENWTDAAHGSQLIFRTCPNGGITLVNSLTLQGNTATFSGNVLIPTTGNVYFGSVIGAASGQVGADTSSMYFRLPGGGAYYFQNNNTSVNVGYLDSAGNFTISGSNAQKASGTTWANPSGRDLKENIQPYAQGLQAILALQPRSFSFAKDSGIDAPGEHIGLIHDETAHMPEMHRRLSLGSGDKAREVDGLDTSAITLALVNACKELAAQNAALTERLAALEAKGTA